VNWLGELIVPRIRRDDTVLDVGCGIMQPTGGRLNCRQHVGVDCFEEYIDRIGQPAILGSLPEAAEQVAAGSFDVVLLLDIIEHLKREEAEQLMASAERIARREVIVFTPDGFVPQEGWGAWDMPHNPAQAHLCGFTFDELTARGYECTRHDNGTSQAGPIVSVLGIKCLLTQT
jgi:hypothetical protein